MMKLFQRFNKQVFLVALFSIVTITGYIFSKERQDFSQQDVVILMAQLKALQDEKESYLALDDLAPIWQNWQRVMLDVQQYGIEFITKLNGEEEENSWQAVIQGPADLVPVILDKVQRRTPIKIVQIELNDSLVRVVIKVLGTI